MLFSSLVFLWYFLPAVFLLYFITKNLHIRNGVLLAASLFFYAWAEVCDSDACFDRAELFLWIVDWEDAE